MGVELISAENIGRSSSGNITVTVPEDCTAAYVFLGGNYSSSGGYFTATLGGNAQDESIHTGGSTSYTNGGAVAFYNPPTGTQTLALTFAQSISMGMGGVIAYVKGGDTTGWRDADIDQQTSTTQCTATVSSSTTDLVLGLHTRITSYPGVPSGWTQVGSNVYYNSVRGLAAQCDSPGGTTTSHAGSYCNYSVVSAISIPAEYIPVEGVSDVGVGVNASADANAELSVSTEENAGVEVQADASYGGATAEFGVGVNADADASQESVPYVFSYIGVNALADADFGLFRGSVDFNAGVKIDADAYIVDGRIYPNAGVSVEAEAYLITPKTDFEVGVSATAEAYREIESICDAAESGINVLADAYNYSEWVRKNILRAKKVFLFTLTGSADGVSDITIPIPSFQARKRTGKPTYLSVTIPTFDYNDQIADRANGEMILYAGYRVGDTLSLIEEILHVDLDHIDPYKGPKSRSVILTGYRTTDFAAKNVTLENPVYSFLGAGSAQHRFANVDLFLNPGDTLTVDGDSIIVGSISYTVNTSSEMMQVFESQ